MRGAIVPIAPLDPPQSATHARVAWPPHEYSIVEKYKTSSGKVDKIASKIDAKHWNKDQDQAAVKVPVFPRQGSRPTEIHFKKSQQFVQPTELQDRVAEDESHACTKCARNFPATCMLLNVSSQATIFCRSRRLEPQTKRTTWHRGFEEKHIRTLGLSVIGQEERTTLIAQSPTNEPPSATTRHSAELSRCAATRKMHGHASTRDKGPENPVWSGSASGVVSWAVMHALGPGHAAAGQAHHEVEHDLRRKDSALVARCFALQTAGTITDERTLDDFALDFSSGNTASFSLRYCWVWTTFCTLLF